VTNKPLRVGIAGYGVVGQRRRQYIDVRDDLQVVAVCDRKYSDTGVFEDGVRYYPHYRELFTEDLDAAFVCLTNDVAAEVTIAALEKGYHVLCEKPPGRDLADIASVIAAEKGKRGQKLKYGFNHRYHDSVLNALGLVGSGELGRVINIRGVYGKSVMINFESDWRTKREIAGGGILLDQGIHMVDLMRLFGGEYTEINSVIGNSFWNHDVEDNAYALMRSESGVVAMLHSSATEWRHRFQFDITLEKGSITLNGILSGSKSYGEETMTVARTNGVFDGDPEEHITRYKDDKSWALEIAEFADAIQNDLPIANGSSKDALKTMQLVYDIYCADPGWKQKWSLDNKVPE